MSKLGCHKLRNLAGSCGGIKCINDEFQCILAMVFGVGSNLLWFTQKMTGVSG